MNIYYKLYLFKYVNTIFNDITLKTFFTKIIKKFVSFKIKSKINEKQKANNLQNSATSYER